MTYEMTKALVATLILATQDLDDSDIEAGIAFLLITIHKQSKKQKWKDVTRDIVATGIDLNA